MKRISVFVHCFPPARGGLEFLMGEIKKLLDDMYEVHIFTGQGSTLDSYKTFKDYVDTTYDAVTIHRLPVNVLQQKCANKFLNKIIFVLPFFSPWYFGPILQYEQKHIDIIQHSDIIIGTGLPTKSVYDAYQFAHRYHKQLIVIPAYHDVSYYNNSYFFQKAFNYASHIICLSQREQTDLLKAYAIPSDKTHIVYFSPFSKTEIQTQQHVLKTEEIPFSLKQHFTLGYVGQISNRKNLAVIKTLLDTQYKTWQNSNREVTVLLAGAKTNDSPAIEALFQDWIKKGVVRIVYNFESKEEIYKNIDVFINPSQEESLGIVNFEAMFYGKPIIVHATSAFAEFIQPPLNGFVFENIAEVAAIIDKLFTQPKLYDSIQQAGLITLTQYSRDIVKDALVKILEI